MKLRTIKLFLIALAVSTLSIAQTTQIELKVLQSFSAQAKLYKYLGSDVKLIDSTWRSAPGEFKFQLEKGFEQGFYRINVGNNISFNIVVSNEPLIDIETVAFAPEDSLRTINSVENRVYWEYQRKKKKQRQQAWLINSLLEYYSEQEMFHNLLQRELHGLNDKLYSLSNRLQKENPKLLASLYINLEQPPLAPSVLIGKERSHYLMDNWWNNVDLNDERLVNSPAFSTRIWGYVELFHSNNFDKEEQDLAFMEAVNNLMNLDMPTETKYLARKILIRGFTDTDYEAVLEHLETTQFGELKPIKEIVSLEDSGLVPITRVGKIAYDFDLMKDDGSSMKLSEIDADYKLILFWSTWCPHCIETMPEIADIYSRYKEQGLEIIAVSIDEEEQLWRRYVSELKMNWVNIRETISKDSKVLYMYNVEATPIMFLLSRDLEIISRPSTRRQLEIRLRRLTR